VLLCCELAAAAPTITVEAPRGGEVYGIGQAQKVLLGAKTRAKSVVVELSRDGGATYSVLGTINNTLPDRTQRNLLAWTVTGPGSGNCLVRATGVVGKAQAVAVSSPFSIGGAGEPLAGSVTTASLASEAVSADKITSGSASGDMVLTADGSGGVTFGPLPLDTRYVKVAGDTMTGPLMLSGDPTAASGAATKQYVDAKAGAASGVAVSAGNSIVAALNDAATTSKASGTVLADGSVGNAKLANSAITITAGTGLAGGGAASLGGATTLNLADTAVTPGSFTRASITVDQQGRLTAAGNGAAIGTADLADGAVTAPKVAAFPKAYVQNSALISVPNNTATVVTCDTELFDTDNCHSTTVSPARLTCNTAGVYYVSAYAAFASNNTNYRQIFVRVNGGTAIASEIRPAYNQTDMTTSTIWQLNAGDYLEMVVVQDSGGPLNVNVRGFMMARLP
jgi:hypothetical protein